MSKPVKYKPYKFNPRKISTKQIENLADTLARLGDLSPIIYNRRSKSFPGGNQRSKTIDFDNCEIVITERLPKKDKQGTTAWGYVLWDGHRYNYREVDWTPAIEKEANIVANKGGGDWDYEVLRDHFPAEKLVDWGFKKSEIPWKDDEDFSSKNKEIDVDSLDAAVELKLYYRLDRYKEVVARLNEIAPTPAEAVWKLLNPDA